MKKQPTKQSRRSKYRPLASSRLPVPPLESVLSLQQELATHGPGFSDRYTGGRVRLEDIVVQETVFQPRHISKAEGGYAFEEHVKRLTEALKHNAVTKREGFPPLLVFPVNRRLYLVDGHARLAALKAAGHREASVTRLPASSVLEAVTVSCRENATGEKKALSATERREAAWRLVCLSYATDAPLSGKEIEEATGYSDSSISRMRAVLLDPPRELLRPLSLPPDASPGEVRAVLLGSSWGKVSQLLREGTGDDFVSPDAEESQVVRAASAMVQRFGSYAERPDMLAAVLVRAFPKHITALQSALLTALPAPIEEESDY